MVQINLNTVFDVQRRFQFSILNPQFVKPIGGGFQVFTMYSNANNIVEAGQILNIFQTTALSWSTLKAYFAWGLPLSDTYPTTVGIFRSDQAAASPFFNTFRFNFQPSADTPINLQLRVTLRLDAEAGSQVLEGSISENLPDFNNFPVKCQLDTTVSTQKKVVCENVGTLKQATMYHISVKVMFPYMPDPQADLGANFGKLKVETYNPSSANYDVNALINEDRDGTAIWSTLSNYQMINLEVSNGYTLVHSQTYVNYPTMVAVAQDSFGISLSQSNP